MRSGMNPPTASRGAAGRWYLVFLGLSVAAIGAVFVALMWRSYDRARQMHHWPEVPCTILSSEVEQRPPHPNAPPEFRASLLYGYEWRDEPHTGTRLTWRGNPWRSDRGAVEKVVDRYAAGTGATCRVNPADPDFAVLEPDSKAPLYAIWFPALFVVGGLGIAWRALRRHQN